MYSTASFITNYNSALDYLFLKRLLTQNQKQTMLDLLTAFLIKSGAILLSIQLYGRLTRESKLTSEDALGSGSL